MAPPARDRQHDVDIDRALHDKEGWSEYRRLVLDKLDGLTRQMEKVQNDVISLRIKAAAWGFVGGGAGSAIGAAILQYLSTRGH